MEYNNPPHTYIASRSPINNAVQKETPMFCEESIQEYKNVVIPEWLNEKGFISNPVDSTDLTYLYLSQVVDVDTLINSTRPVEQDIHGSMRIYLIKSPMGSGKTHIITDLTNKYNEAGQPVGHMMVYKKNIQDIIEETKMVEYLEIFTEKAIKENISDRNRYAHIQTYTKRFFDVFAEGLIEQRLESMPEDGFDTYQIIDNYFTDKVIFVDECDYIINMLAAFTSSFESVSLQGTKIWDEKYNRLKEAAKQFYAEIAQKCKALVLFTATTTSEFLELLPECTEVINPTDYLADNERIRSISIASITYVPFFEWDYGSQYDNLLLSDRIIEDITQRIKWDKALQFSPNIRKRHIQHYLGKYRTGILAPPHKLNDAAKGLCSLTDESKLQVRLHNSALGSKNAVAGKLGIKKAVLIHISDFDTSDNALVNLHTVLNNEFVDDHDVILITGSNARAANITTEYDEVLVITDAPWNAEIIQAIGRFRNARIYVYILHRVVSKRTYDARRYAIDKAENEIRTSSGVATRKKSDRERHSPTWWRRNSTDIYNYWADRAVPLDDPLEEIQRIDSLINEIEDFDFTLGNSMLPFSIQVDTTYCHPSFSLSINRKAEKIKSFLMAYTDLSRRDVIEKWKETYPEDKVISSATITKYKKELQQ